MTKMLLDITLSCSVTSVIFTCYNTLRQKANETGGRLEEKTAETEFSINSAHGEHVLQYCEKVNASFLLFGYKENMKKQKKICIYFFSKP